MAKPKKASSKKLNPKLFLKWHFLPIILSLVLIVLTIFAYQVFLDDKYYPFTFVGNTNISFLPKGQAIKKLQTEFNKRAQQRLSLNLAQNSYTIDLATSSATLDYSALDSSFRISHGGGFLNRLKNQLQSLIFPNKIYPQINLSLDKQINDIALSVNKPPKNAELIFDEITNPEGSTSARIQIKEGEDGIALNTDETKKIAVDFLLNDSFNPQLPLDIVTPKATTDHIKNAKEVLEQISAKPIKLQFNEANWTIDAKQLLTLLNLTDTQKPLLDKEQVSSYLKNIAQAIDQEVQEGLFEFNTNTHRVAAFKASREGRSLNQDETYKLLNEALTDKSFKQTITLPVDVVKPKISTSDVNSLGINELLGQGVSNFAGSIANRIYNVGLTATRINGVLVPPGEVFSFNKTIGDVSAATGYKQAYVIKEGRTVLDDGGGVCQDSTTLFRAVLNAGLPVVKRTAHAYRVGYYEQGFPPGLDATVFYPSVDFQFKNDTKHHILIQAYTSGTTLYVDLYGTKDGRTVSLTKPIIGSQTPPPPELRQDDPTLPKGTIKQVDWAAWGANVSFKRTVTKDGETIINETWQSNYRPWQAVYLVGTQ